MSKYEIETSETEPTVLVLGYSGASRIRRAGGIAETCSDTDASAWLAVQEDDVHGLLLMGGGDVNPRLYGEQPHKSVYGVSNKRDDVESTAIAIARERGIPIMGICRGAQMINVTAGGTLHQNITDDPQIGHYHRGTDTTVRAVRGSRLAQAFGDEPRMTTHIHHQAVKDLAPGFVATAFTRDGCIEAIESVHAWELGVQFHPEMLDDRPNQRIFERFVAAAAAYAGILDFETPEYVPAGTTRFGSGWREGIGVTEVERVSHKIDRKRERARIRRESMLDDFDPGRMACGICNISRFDNYEDWTDHLSILHGVDTSTLVALEARAAALAEPLVLKSARESASVFEERMQDA